MAPNGTLTADEIVPTVALGWLQPAMTVDGSSYYTQSCFAKASAGHEFGLRLPEEVFDGDATMIYNLLTGEIPWVGAGAVDYGMIPLVDGWWWCYVTALSDVADSSVCQVRANDGSVYAWGSQFDKGTFPSSYIKTEATPVTRPKTEAYWDAADVPATVRDGAFAVNVVPNGAQDARTGTHVLWSLYDSSSTRIVTLQWNGSTGTYQVVNDTPATLVESAAVTYSHAQEHTVVVDAAAGQMTIIGATTGNGTTTDTSWDGYMPATSVLYSGQDKDDANQFDGLLSELYRKAA